MRRSYISPEYTNSPIYGTFNMKEESNFFSAKMLEIEDSIYISNQNIIYYQKLNGEQLDLSIESSLPTQIYSASENMMLYQTLAIDENQLQYQKDNNTKWILDINLKDILTDYLYAIMKRYRTFEGINNYQTINNDINTAMKEYISNNVSDRYKFSKIDLYIVYNDLKNQNVLRYNNIWNPEIAIDSNLLNKKQLDLAHDDSTLKIYFNQEKPSLSYNFDYYFNILFVKI